jgi:hypothetical protein
MPRKPFNGVVNVDVRDSIPMRSARNTRRPLP